MKGEWVMTRQLSKWMIALLVLPPGLAMAAVPATLSFSARIADAGTPVTGSHAFGFAIWDVESGGTAGSNVVWGESQTLTVNDGVVTAVLGADTTTPNPLPVSAFTGAALFLEVSMDGTAFGPRMALHSVPYAFRAGVADSVATGVIPPGSLAGTAGAAGQVPVSDGSSSFTWMTPAPAVHTHVGSDVTSAVANATNAALAADLACSGCVGDADVATGISGSKISGAVATATFATSAGTASIAALASDLSCTGCVQSAEIQSVAWAKVTGTPATPAAGSSAASGTISVSTTAVQLASAITSIPAWGYVMIIGEAEWSANTTGQYIGCTLRDNGTTVRTFDWDPGDADGWYDLHQTIVHGMTVQAGAHTFSLWCGMNTGTASAIFGQVHVMYFPSAL